LNSDTCQRIIARCLPQSRILSAEPIQEGWCSFVLDVNGEHIFRFARWPEIEAQFRMEMRLLPELAPALPVAVPRFEFSWKDCPGCEIPFVGYRKIPGVPLNRLPPSRELACQLAAILSALHRFPTARALELSVPDLRPPRWQREYEGLYEWAQRSALPMLEPSARSAVDSRWEAFLGDEANFRFPPALIHRDLGAEHILCDPEENRATGIIDWGDACIGDPALDFVGLWADCGRSFAEQVAAEYGGEIGAAFWNRAAFYLAIIPFYYIQYAQQISDEALLREGVERLNRLP
jgi:aminoglycoside 2''-phosphotransferase